MTDKLTPGHQEDAKKIVEFIGSVKPEAMTDKKQISTIPLLKILTKYAIKHAVAFSGVESNAIVEAMQEHAESWHSAKMREVTDDSVYKRFFDKCNDLHPDLTFDILKLLDSDC